MFIGRYYHTIEEKGRVSLPKTFREQGESWVITRGLDGGLFLFLNNSFATELAKLQEKSLTKRAHRDMLRYFANDAHAVAEDTNGRILIPEHLRATAQLTKQVVIIGSYTHIEIWDVEKYHSYLETLTNRAEEIAEGIQ